MATSKKAETAAVETKAAKAAETKVAEKKPACKRFTTKVSLFVEYQGRQVNQDDVVKAVKAAAGSAKTLNIYMKPEENVADYVADGVEGKVSF